MPTGYTAKIAEGQSFEEFVWGTIQAFGIYLNFRSDDIEYYTEQLKEYQEELKRVKRLTFVEAQDEEFRMRQEAVKRVQEHNQRSAGIEDRYLLMLDRLNAWQPDEILLPYKNYLLEQVKSSLEFDCGPIAMPKEEKPIEYQKRMIDHYKWIVESNQKSLDNAIKRKELNALWIETLKQTVPLPAKE